MPPPSPTPTPPADPFGPILAALKNFADHLKATSGSIISLSPEFQRLIEAMTSTGTATNKLVGGVKELGRAATLVPNTLTNLVVQLKALSGIVAGETVRAMGGFVDILRPLSTLVRAVTSTVTGWASSLIALLPTLGATKTKLATFLNDVVGGALAAFSILKSALPPSIKAALAGVGDAVTSSLGKMKASLAKVFDDVVGGALAAFSILKKLLPDSVKKAAYDVTGGALAAFSILKSALPVNISSALGAVGGAVTGTLGKVGSFAASSLGAVGAGLGKLAGGAFVAVQGVMAAGEAMSSFIAKANPGALIMFQNVLDDLMAVVGASLTPVFRIITQIMRMFGDTLMSFLPTIGGIIGEMAQGLMPLFNIFMTVISHIGQGIGFILKAAQPLVAVLEQIYAALYEALLPLFDTFISIFAGVFAAGLRLVGAILQAIMPYILRFADLMRQVFEQLLKWTKDLLEAIGGAVPEFKGVKSGESVGQAVKGTSIGSVDEMWKKAITAAYSLGGASSPELKAAETTAANTAKTNELLSTIASLWFANSNLNAGVAKSKGLNEARVKSNDEFVAPREGRERVRLGDEGGDAELARHYDKNIEALRNQVARLEKEKERLTSFWRAPSLTASADKKHNQQELDNARERLGIEEIRRNDVQDRMARRRDALTAAERHEERPAAPPAGVVPPGGGWAGLWGGGR